MIGAEAADLSLSPSRPRRHAPLDDPRSTSDGTSRTVLAAIEQAGHQPEVIEYLKTGWTRGQLLGLFAASGMTPRQALRDKEAIASELGLLDSSVSAEQIVSAMVEHPVLVNRPIVITPKGVKLCRPAELVDALL